MAAVDNLSGDFVSKMQQKLGYPYLHYESYQSANLGDASLEKLWASQKSLFAKRFNVLNKQGSSGRNYGQISRMLRNWNTNGEIGSGIISGLQNIALFDANGQSTAYGTSGGVQVGDFTVANARTAFNTSRDRARASITPIIKAVNHSINNIIRILAENKEYLLAEAIKEAYYSGQRTPPADLGIPADTSVGKNLIAVADNKLITTVQTLQNSLNELAKLEGATLQADPYKAAYSEILGSIRASLNSIGGTMHEVGFTLAALEAAKKAEKTFQKANKAISSTVTSGGGTFTAHWTAQDVSDAGSETKDDVTISWNTGNATITFGGSIKLRQGQAFRGSGPGSQSLAVAGFVVRQENLEQNLRKLEQYAPGVTQAGVSMIAALNAGNAAGEWYQIKQRLGMLNLVDAIAGSGLKGDFSTLLIINNRIFTMTDILDRIGQTLAQIGESGGIGKGYTVQGADLGKMQNQIREHINNFPTPGQQALSRNRMAWEILQNEKISISLNLGYLFGEAVFR